MRAHVTTRYRITIPVLILRDSIDAHVYLLPTIILPCNHPNMIGSSPLEGMHASLA